MSEANDDYADREQSIDRALLYDLTVQTEWRLDPEPLAQPGGVEKQTGNRPNDASSGWSMLRTIGLAVGPAILSYLPASFMRLVNSQPGWKFSLTSDGELLAILQDNCIEIRSSENEYTAVRSRWLLKLKDSSPQWRCITWSPGGEMIAVSDSSGNVLIYDEMGVLLTDLPSNCTGSDVSTSLCSLIFKPLTSKSFDESRGEEEWLYELLAINYQGLLTSYLISSDGGSRRHYTFSFQDSHPDGVTSATYHVTQSLLVLGGLAQTLDVEEGDERAAVKCGLSLWRNLSDQPYFRLVTDLQADSQGGKRLMSRLRGHWYSWYSTEAHLEYVYRLALSPTGSHLVSLHQSGMVTVWRMPSLRVVQTWQLDKQPGFDLLNEEVLRNAKRRKAQKDHLEAFHLSDIDWWSDEALILARACGSVTICSCKSLCNLLGASPEWFEPVPQVSRAGAGSFLGLECETTYVTLKRQQTDADSSHERASEECVDDEDDDETVTLTSRVSRYVSLGLYYVTDIERFQPPRKRPRFLSKTYRLICLRSTTPDELYSRKINNEEYGDALQLAKAYDLDCDLVYQRQWRRAPATVLTIQDYLSKIKKRSWVLHECLERVPEDLDAMQELVLYGLRGTDVEALVAIGNKEDGGRFITSLEDINDEYLALNESHVTHDDESLTRRRNELLKTVDFNNLSLDQQDLCRARRKLLQYSDRLQTYQAILGGYHVAPDKYDAKFFQKFRSENIVKLAVEYAQAGNAEALDYIFTYHGAEVLPHRLSILRNFPETCCPTDYHKLLPEASWEYDGMIGWVEATWRQPDWCEQQQEHCSTSASDVEEELEATLYEQTTNNQRFRGKELSHSLLCAWYEMRCCEIERLSGQVDYALTLVHLAIEKNIPGLENLQDDLQIMETLIYECRVDESLSFAQLRQMSPLERIRLMMNKSTEEMYIKNVRKWLVPYLKKCEEKCRGSYYTVLREYIVSLAKDDLTLCVHVFKASKPSNTEPIISDQCQHMSIAMECIYAYTGNDELEKAFEILGCLPQRGTDTDIQWTQLHDQLDQLENHLRGAEILGRNGLPQTVSFVRDSKDSADEAVKLMTRIMRTSARRAPALGESKLRKVLQDMCELRDKVYKCLDTTVCHEIFVESLLCSGSLSNISLAGRMIQCSEHSSDQGSECRIPIGYKKSVELVLQAAREYFDSAADLRDSDMELARSCLALITDRNTCIEEERDLIEAVGMLQELDIAILPVQVRVSTDRLQLVQRVLAADPHAYRALPKLLKLGKLLRVTGGNEITASGQVLQLVARAALRCSDYSIAYEACTQMIGAGYGEAWKECLALAEASEYNELQDKTILLSFAVSHCSPELIESLLRARCALQAQILQDQIRSHIGERDSQSPPVETGQSPLDQSGSGLSAGRSALDQTREILESTNRATRTVLSHLGNKKWWKRTLNNLQPSRLTHNVDEFDDLNNGFIKYGTHPFYESLHTGCYLNNGEVNYSAITQSQKQQSMIYLHECILRAAKLEEMLEQCDNTQSVTQVLLLLAEDVIVQDSFLGLSYLLALPDPCQADECFEKIPGTGISLQLAVYYYSLHICCWLRAKSHPQLDELYRWEPSKMCEAVLRYVQSASRDKLDTDWSGEVRQLVERFLHHHGLLQDFIQAQMLQRVNKGVDISRFVREDTYKKETILGMIMCLDEDVFSTALSLAKRYKIPMSEVYMTHLEALFDDESVTTHQIQERVKRLGIMAELTRKQDGGYEMFVSRMQQNVYPLIDGVDHDRLLLYFSLLSSVSVSTSACASAVSAAQSHSKLLAKLHTIAPGVNYKHLTDGTRPLLDILMPVLTADNYNSLATLTNSIVKKDGTSLQASNVYRVWAAKLFMDGPQEKRLAQNMSEWIQRFELTEDLQLKLSTDDYLAFILDITFSKFAYKQLVIDCRRQILRRAVKFARQQQTTNRPRTNSRNIKSWEEVMRELQLSLEHLDKLGYPPIQEMKASSDTRHHEYVCLFDLSRSDCKKIEELMMKILLDGQPLEVAEDFHVASKIEGLTLRIVLERVIHLALEALGRPSTEAVLRGLDVASALKTVVKQVHKHQLDGGQLADCGDVVRVLKPYCCDATVKCSNRLTALDILELALEMNVEDRTFLLHNRSQALITSIDNQLLIDDQSLDTDDSRLCLFNQLLCASSGLSQFLSVSQLLLIWPKFLSASSQLDDPGTNPWCRLITAMIRAHPVESIPHVINIVLNLHKTNDLPCKCTRYVADSLMSLSSSNCSAAAKCLLSSSHTELNEYATELLHSLPVSCDDVDLFDLIIKCCIIANVTTSSIYPKIISFILSKQQTSDVETTPPYYLHIDTVVSQLQEAGLQQEANNLLSQHRAVNKASNTLDTAINAFSRFFKR